MSIKNYTFIVILTLFFGLGSFYSVFATDRTITAEDLWKVQRTGSLTASPDGNFVAFTVTSYDIDKNNSSTNIYLLNVSSGEYRQFTNSGSDRAPVWSPDSRYLAFVSNRGEGPAQLYVMPVHGGEARKVTDLPVGVSAPKWFPDGKSLAFSANVIPGYGGDFDKLSEMLAEQRNTKVTAKVTENRVYRFWDRWLTDGHYPRLFRVHLETEEVVDLMPGSKRFFAMMGAPGYDISPDGKEIAVSANSNPPPYEYLNYDIFLVPTDGSGELNNITEHNPANDTNPVYSPDGSTLLYGKQLSTDFYADRTRLVFYNRESGERNIVDNIIHEENIDLSPSGFFYGDNRTLYFQAQDRGMTSLFSYDLRRNRLSEVVRGGTNSGATLAGNQLYFVHSSLSKAPEMHKVRTNGRNLEKVTSFNDKLFADVKWGNVEDVRYKGANGVDVQMFIVYPPDFDSSEKYPLLMQIHGGPHGIFGDDFHFRWNAQLFAAPGYVVAMPNFHGSTSFGQDFAKSIHGNHWDLPYRDIMKATDFMIARGYIYENRMAAAGGSYGGYMVSWIAGHTDRFQALINHAGVYNIMTQFASDVTAHREVAYGGSTWNNIENMQRSNPALLAENFVTPMLVIHGELDYRVPVSHGLEVYGAYKGKGLEARLVYYPDENHWILNPQNSIHWFGEFHGWLKRFIGYGPTE